MVRQIKRTENWLGKPIGSNKPYNFFKTNRKDYPVRMFGDSDKDGVANVFDCKPNDPNRQGILAAIAGAVGGLFKKGKGTVSEGWKAGMEKPGIIKTIQLRREAATEKYTSERANALKLAKAIAYRQELVRAKQEAFKKQKSAFEKRQYEKIHPVKAKVMKYPTTQIGNLREYQMEMIRRLQEGKLKLPQKEKIATVRKSMKLLFPVIPAGATSATYGYQSKAGTRAGRGRPPRSYDPRYAAYGGVMGYRKAMSAQRSAFRERLRQQQEIMRMQKQMPQYEQQLPQEMQGQGVIPEYSQFPQVQEAQPQEEQALSSQPIMQEYPAQEMPRVYPQPPQEAPQRAIGTVFKGFGGKPYPAVERTPLAPPRQTIPQGYVETVDSFTGRRFLKSLPKPENWIR